MFASKEKISIKYFARFIAISAQLIQMREEKKYC